MTSVHTYTLQSARLMTSVSWFCNLANSAIPLSVLYLRSHSQQSQSNEALSYAWGNSDRTHLIWAPGRLFIEKNLHSALQHLPLPDRARTLWADAICINQDSVPERNQQVQ